MCCARPQLSNGVLSRPPRTGALLLYYTPSHPAGTYAGSKRSAPSQPSSRAPTRRRVRAAGTQPLGRELEQAHVLMLIISFPDGR